MKDWEHRAELRLSAGLLVEFYDMRDAHPWYFNMPDSYAPAPTRSPDRGMGSDVEQWRDLVSRFFPADAVDNMLCIMEGESGGNPNAVNPKSGAAGLFQIMPFWWNHYGGDRFDPERNVQVARWIWDQQSYGGWSAWRKC